MKPQQNKNWVESAKAAIVEVLAATAHFVWADWMKYQLLECATQNPDGSITISPDKVARWSRQMQTPYKALPESEKVSDRAEARKIIKEGARALSELMVIWANKIVSIAERL